jgi:predicted Zn-dependent protease
MGIQMGTQGLMLKYSRGDESQADAVGAMVLYKARYNPKASHVEFEPKPLVVLTAYSLRAKP